MQKETVLIFDEGDELIFNDLKAFYNKTKKKNAFVICLTATADDGNDKGVERVALEKLEYAIYYN